MPLGRVTQIRADAAESIACIEMLIAGMERSLDAIEARLKRLKIIRKAASVRSRPTRTLQ